MDGEEKKTNRIKQGLSRKHLTEACHEALQRLQVDYLDIYFCHRPDKNVPIEEVVWTMNILLQQGKILYWGTSEWSAAEIMEAHRVAAQFGLIGRQWNNLNTIYWKEINWNTNSLIFSEQLEWEQLSGVHLHQAYLLVNTTMEFLKEVVLR